MTNGIFGEVHATLRGATSFGTAFRWVRSLARASHRLPSRMPPARGAGGTTVRAHSSKSCVDGARLRLAAFIAVLAFVVPSTHAESLTLLPAKFTLDGPAAEQRLVLELADGKTLLGQVTNAITFTSSNPKVVRIEDGLAIAVGNGTATVTGKSGRSSTKAEVRVVNMEKPFEWSFRNHLQPVLTKTGCNSGACHGAAAGERLQALAARLRRGRRPPRHHALGARAARHGRGAGAQPPAHQAHHRCPAQRRRAFHHQLARLPHLVRVDCERHPCPAAQRRAHH